MLKRTAWFFVLGLAVLAEGAPRVAPSKQGLLVDGKPIPYLFGAETQYFRARGGPGRNVPAAEVRALWEKLLDRVVEAKMNSVLFYIPWDFHEPVEGVFDFDGTLDQDKDGRPDYPSRNLKLFLDLVEARGIKHVMIRPGPYINAEWGPVGFGAIPKWFLDHYPHALSPTLTPGKPKTASFSHPEYRMRVVRWFTELYRQVLRPRLGRGKAIQFLQLDNETNYFWDSVYERDSSPGSLERYRAFTRKRFSRNLHRMRDAYGPGARFERLLPPKGPEDASFSRLWHYDWFHFHDAEVHDYFRFLRTAWERLGVDESKVLFTSCDSFNAPASGLLPRLDYRQRLSMSTVNVYPKTFGTAKESILNFPMKAAHDARLFLSAHRQFGGWPGEWLMSSETMAGWFPPVEVTLSARRHTYGSLMGNGVKALMLYYFHEGWNWNGTETGDTELRFDAPLDKDLSPRGSFAVVRDLGEALSRGLGRRLAETRPPSSRVLLAHDGDAQYPLDPKVDALERVSTAEAAAFGLFREAGAVPDVAYLEALSAKELASYRLVVLTTPGYFGARAAASLRRFIAGGGTVLSFGKIPLKGLPTDRVVEWESDFANVWNDGAAYPKSPDLNHKLDRVKNLLRGSGTPDLLLAHPSDGEPGVHLWYRAGKQGILFVENFSERPRKIEVDLGGVAPYGRARLTRLWGGSSETVEAIRVGSSLVFPFETGGDGVEIWAVSSF